jgi:photosystem II stability/assembly factor-like uncharacterized protein
MKRSLPKPAMVFALALMGALLACDGGSPTGGDNNPPSGTHVDFPNVSNPEVRLAPGGVEWTRRESGTLSGLIAVTSGNGKIVIVGNNGVVLTSTDGLAWSLHNVGVNVAMNYVIWTGDKFIAVGDSGTIATSPDGAQWVLRKHSQNYHLETVAWNGKTFVAAGGKIINSGLTQPAMLTSPDGENWTETSQGDGLFYGAAWGGIAFLAVGFNYDFSTVADYSNPVMYLSRDGKSWDVINANIEDHNSFNHIIFDGQRFVAVGGSRNVNDSFATVYTTSDFNQWTRASVSTRKSLEGVAYTGSEYFAVGHGGVILRSDSAGGIWRTRASGVTANLNAIAATSLGWQLIAVGDSGTILTSPCGQSQATPPALHPLVGYWKEVQDVIRHGNGTQTITPMDSTLEMLFGFRADQSVILFAFEGGALVASEDGTWSATGSRLTLSIAGAPGTGSDYTLAGDQLRFSAPDTLAGENVTRTTVLQRL